MKNLILGFMLFSTMLVSVNSNTVECQNSTSSEYFFENCFSTAVDVYNAFVEGGVDHDSAMDGAMIRYRLCRMLND